jgi:biopolymer transport protein ExbD
MRIQQETKSSAQINIIPMIDIIFSILAFFIFQSVYLTKYEGLDVDLPEASNVRSQQGEQVNVTVQKNGVISINKQSVSLEKLTTKVTELIRANSSSLVVIQADRQVEHGKVVAVMDRLREMKGIKLAIAAESIENLR